MNLNKLYQQFPTTSKPDFQLLAISVWLIIFGIIMIMSSSNVIGYQDYNQSFYFVFKHLIFVFIGILGFFAAYIIPHQFLRKFCWGIWAISLVLAGMTHIPGVGITISGSTRWINLLGITFQPSELVKFSTLLMTADYIDKYQHDINTNLKRFGILLGIIGISAAIVLSQPDLGTTGIIVLIFLSQIFVAGIRLDIMIGMFCAALGVVGLSILAQPYQLARVQGFINPWADKYGKGFHIIQSMIAVGSGGLLGLGFGQSRQKFFYLPQQYTDYIFAIICEELGFVYTTLFFIIPMTILYIKCYFVAVRQTELFSKLLVTGITTWLAFQSFVNMGVAINLVPSKGITLPFISFGGTSVA
ncbi:MAG: putative peptidoglycan glycosyltransferase FtsW, partial [Candidatus Riflemargulisbacteria bacterium]